MQRRLIKRLISHHEPNALESETHAGAITPKFKQLSAGRFAKMETAKNLDDCGLYEKLTNYKYHRS